MPGFGTTDRTYNNAIDLMKSLGISIREISIQDACIQHFKDIDHDINVHDVTYENSQARERTQILMDIANQTWGRCQWKYSQNTCEVSSAMGSGK